MKWRRHAIRLVVLAALLGLDAGFGRWAVEVNAAGALLSPGGAMPLEAIFAALGFLGARLGWMVALTTGAGLLAADAVKQAWRRPELVRSAPQGSR